MGEAGQAAASCVRHPEAPAAHYCSACNANRCTECAKRTWYQGGFVNLCGTCGGLLQEIGALHKQTPVRVVPDAGANAFVERLPDILLFPFQRNVLILLMGLAALVTPIEIASRTAVGVFGMVGAFIVAGLEVMTFFYFILQTAHGARVDALPSVDDVWEDLVDPVFLYLAATRPIIVGVLMWGETHYGTVWAGLAALAVDPTLMIDTSVSGLIIIAGVALLPLLTAIAALSRSFLSILNPVLWVESLRIMWATYPIAAACYYAVWSFEAFVWTDVRAGIYDGLDIPVLTTYIVHLLGYLPMALTGRIIGAMCEPYLGDFE